MGAGAGVRVEICKVNGVWGWRQDKTEQGRESREGQAGFQAVFGAPRQPPSARTPPHSRRHCRRHSAGGCTPNHPPPLPPPTTCRMRWRLAASGSGTKMRRGMRRMTASSRSTAAVGESGGRDVDTQACTQERIQAGTADKSLSLYMKVRRTLTQPTGTHWVGWSRPAPARGPTAWCAGHPSAAEGAQAAAARSGRDACRSQSSLAGLLASPATQLRSRPRSSPPQLLPHPHLPPTHKHIH